MTVPIDNDSSRPGWLRAVLAVGRRWPTIVALAWAAISLSDFDGGMEYVILFAAPPAGYLFLALADRPRITWAVVFGVLGTVVVLRLLKADPWPAMAVASVALIALGLVNGRLRRPGLYAWQAPGAVVFIGFGLVVLALTGRVSADLAGYLVALGLLGHATWDFIHLRAEQFVSRSFPEWCGVLDLVLGVGIVVLLLTT